MTDTTPRSAMPLLAAAQAQKHVTHNEALVQLDALLYARILDRDLTAPPSTPADGDAYLVKAAATGAWTGQSGKLAAALDGAWRFYPPFTGLSLYVADEQKLIVFDGAAWLDYAAILAFQNVPLIGINTAADTTNRLAVKSAALLFDNAGAGIQARLNKHAAGDTASLLWQTGYSERAELGLAGDDNLHLKVSPDGSAWTEALTVAASGGCVGLPAGQLAFPAAQNPSSGPNTLDDYEEGTFMPGVAFGGAATGVTYSAQAGAYTKIGNRVCYQAVIVLTSKGSATGVLTLTGLPFVSQNVALQSASAVVRVNTMASATATGALQCSLPPNTTAISVTQMAAGVVTSITDADIANNQTFTLMGHYTAA